MLPNTYNEKLGNWFYKNCNLPLQLFIEKRQFFNQTNQWLNNIMYHK